MKHFLILLTLAFVLPLQAQKSGYQNITDKRIQYLSSKMTLTADEAQIFWPIYREYHSKREEISNAKKKLQVPNINSDAAYLNTVNAYIDAKFESAELLKEYHMKYLEILPAQKVFELYMFDEEFNKKLLKGIKEAGRNKKR